MHRKVSKTSASSSSGWLIPLLILLAVVLGVFFFSSFKPNQALFSNDGPLGVQVAAPYQLPGAFFGIWNDHFWVGAYNGNFSFNITGLMLSLLGPIGFNKFSVPLALLILGLCAAFFFRTLGLHRMACLLGGLAAALNMNFFSNACWGLPTRALSLAATFLALTAIHSSLKNRPLLKTILAGLAIGLSISEGGDNGAIFSLFVAAFAFVATLIRPQPASLGWRAAQGVGRVALMAAFAALLAAQTILVFSATSVQGIVGTEQDAATKAQKWDEATQWSLPPRETLRVLIPGLFGYRMDTEDGGQYWGRVGEAPQYPEAMARYSGAGEYAGVLVVLIALWALAQSFRGSRSAFGDSERKMIWLWAGLAFGAMLLSWGRHAPFYQLVYALPYFSTIRNPMKFMHPFHMALLILFAYGLDGLARVYLLSGRSSLQGVKDQFQSWWKQASLFEKRWTRLSLAAAAAGFVLYFFLFSGRQDLAQSIGKLPQIESQAAPSIARFCIREVGWFAIYLLLSVGAVLWVQTGWFSGRRSLVAAALLGLILIMDLGRANLPWIKYFDYQKRYAPTPINNILKETTPEYRVASIPKQFQFGPALDTIRNFYDVELLQHQFQYHNIPSLDTPQEPRMPADKLAYLTALGQNLPRLWTLTSSRYIFGVAGNFAEALNQNLDPAQKRFRLHTPFTLYQTGPNSQYFGATITNAGPFALLEFTGALPRAKLYAHWQVNTNDQQVLQTLATPAFDPAQTVLVMDPNHPPPDPATSTNLTLDPVQFASYQPKHIELKTSAPAESILLLNDKWHPDWKAWVDGEPQPILRCNYFMRGLRLPPGSHTVEFRFRSRLNVLYISNGAILLGLLLSLFLFLTRSRPDSGPNATSPA